MRHFPQDLWKTMRKSPAPARLSAVRMGGYTGSTPAREPVNGCGRIVRILFIGTVLWFCGPGGALAVHESVIRGIAAELEGRLVTLKMNMREPAGAATHVPMFDEDGWHFWDPSGRIVLPAGERVEVTGVFNYSTRGFFLELARQAPGLAPVPIERRERIRFRLMVEALGESPGRQLEEAMELIGRIVDLSSRPPVSSGPTVQVP